MALDVYQQISESLNKAKNIFIAPSKNPKGDLLGSAFALLEILNNQNKKSIIAADGNLDFYKDILDISKVKNKTFQSRRLVISINNSNNLDKFYWKRESCFVQDSRYVNNPNFNKALSDNSKNKLSGSQSRANALSNGLEKINIYLVPKTGVLNQENISIYQGAFDCDLIISLGASDLESIGHIYSENTVFFHETPIINIDYKLSNEKFGEINLIESTNSSVSEILFNLFKKIYPRLLNPQTQNSKNIVEKNNSNDRDIKLNLHKIATYLLLGIIDETRNFKKATVSPQTLEIASKLLELKADREKIVKILYYNKSVRLLKLYGRAMARLKVYASENILTSNSSKISGKTLIEIKDNDAILSDRISQSYGSILITMLNDDDFVKSKTSILDLPLVFNDILEILDCNQTIIMLAKFEDCIYTYIKRSKALDMDLEKIFWQKNPQKITDDIIYFKTYKENILRVEKKIVDQIIHR